MTQRDIRIVQGDQTAWTASMYPHAIDFTPISSGYIYTDWFAGFTHFVSNEDFDDKMAAMQDVGWKFYETPQD